MPENSLYRNTIDYQLSKVTENDQDFKMQLATIYSDYMRDIPPHFARLIERKSLPDIVKLQHKHKTTCHVLALQSLSDTFSEAENILSEEIADREILLNSCAKKVTTICYNALTQLQEITHP